MLPHAAIVLFETLPSWPAVQDPTVLELLFVTLLLPLAIALGFGALILAPGWFKRGESQE